MKLGSVNIYIIYTIHIDWYYRCFGNINQLSIKFSWYIGNWELGPAKNRELEDQGNRLVLQTNKTHEETVKRIQGLMIVGYGPKKFFFGRDRWWNIFDFETWLACCCCVFFFWGGVEGGIQCSRQILWLATVVFSWMCFFIFILFKRIGILRDSNYHFSPPFMVNMFGTCFFPTTAFCRKSPSFGWSPCRVLAVKWWATVNLKKKKVVGFAGCNLKSEANFFDADALLLSRMLLLLLFLFMLLPCAYHSILLLHTVFLALQLSCVDVLSIATRSHLSHEKTYYSFPSYGW